MSILQRAAVIAGEAVKEAIWMDKHQLLVSVPASFWVYPTIVY
jgi:hypothetical protein